MSALYVRNTFRSWAQLISGPLAIQFYDTINFDQNPSDATWWTMEFFADYIEGETYCGPGYLETGAAKVVVLSKPGLGDQDAVSALEALVREIYNQIDPTQRLVLGQFEAVQEESVGSADRNFRVSAFVGYRYAP